MDENVALAWMGCRCCNVYLYEFGVWPLVMSGLFSKPKAPPPPPGPDPELLRRQREQEERAERERRQRAREISARRRARSSAGQRQLLSDVRPNPQVGIEEELQETFGDEVAEEYIRNPSGGAGTLG
ncbi:uncharacterized protein METZ01_LOCUS284540, partial [marine metagenome]